MEKASEALSISQQIANEKIKEVQKKIVEVEELREEDKVMLDQGERSEVTMTHYLNSSVF